jgi:RNA polymerase sigma-70 factor (ECF subfamily)
MSYLQEVDLGGAFPPFVSFEEHFGVVPNLFRAQTLLPRVLEGEAELMGAVLFKDSILSRIQKESILLAVGVEYQSNYCVALHYQVLRSLGVPVSQLDQIVIYNRKAALSTSDAALLDFAIKLAMRAPWLSREDIELLRDRGFNDESILEAILVTSLASFLSTLSTGLSPSPDFEPRVIPVSNHTSPPKGAYVGGTGGPYLRAVERSPESFPPFAIFLERFGFIPNLSRAQTLRPDVLEAEVELFGNVLGPKDVLSHVQKECILLVAAAANLNTYCVADHCEMLHIMGLSREEADQIALDHHEADLPKETKALLDFALKLAGRRFRIGSEDIDELIGHGFTEEHILETVAVTALNNFLNTLQMGLGTTPDVKPRHVYTLKDALPALAEEYPTEGAKIDPDASLVARVQAGDLDAFEELVIRHSRRVHRTLVGIVGNVQEAQDAFQETFLKAFRYIGSFEGRSTFSRWLLSIASNTALQCLRERKPLESFDEEDHGEEFHPRFVRAWGDNPEQLYSEAERRELVERAVMGLPSKYRVVLVLRDIEQVSTGEAAAALNLEIPTVKSRLLRARLMLREALAPHFATSAKRMGL